MADCDAVDPLAVVLTHLQAAVTTPNVSGGRPQLTFTGALTEALADWVTIAAAEHHRSEPVA